MTNISRVDSSENMETEGYVLVKKRYVQVLEIERLYTNIVE